VLLLLLLMSPLGGSPLLPSLGGTLELLVRVPPLTWWQKGPDQ
jgi:hypothetical protein